MPSTVTRPAAIRLSLARRVEHHVVERFVVPEIANLTVEAGAQITVAGEIALRVGLEHPAAFEDDDADQVGHGLRPQPRLDGSARRVFVTLEGVDGAGKSTQAKLLADALGPQTLLLREPGGTPVGERLRELLKDGTLELSPRSELLLFCAARAELVERVIAPALSRGETVLCDRFLDSSLAYQGIARGLGIERVLELNLNAIRGLLPDRTFLLLVDPEQAAERTGAPRDRIEREGGQFLAEVDRAYRELARIFPQRIEALDGTRPPTELADEIHGRLRDGS